MERYVLCELWLNIVLRAEVALLLICMTPCPSLLPALNTNQLGVSEILEGETFEVGARAKPKMSLARRII